MLIITSVVLCFGGFAAANGTVYLGNRPVKDAVVWLDGGPHPTPLIATVDQRGKKFIPHVSVVPKGSTVNFPNNDEIYHNIFAEYSAAHFDFGMYPKGAKKSMTFPKPGLVAMLCNVHAEMSAYIYVVDSTYFGMTDGSGNFNIEGVKPGSYTLNVWHESGRTFKEKISIPLTGGLTVRLRK